jgi:hypothetical protein
MPSAWAASSGGHRPVGRNRVGEGEAPHVFHDEVGDARPLARVMLACVVDIDDVHGARAELRRDLGLEPEALEQLGHHAVRSGRRGKLDRHLVPERLVDGEPHLGHPAFADLSDQPVPAGNQHTGADPHVGRVGRGIGHALGGHDHGR